MTEAWELPASGLNHSFGEKMVERCVRFGHHALAESFHLGRAPTRLRVRLYRAGE